LTETLPVALRTCPDCGTELATSLLACPACEGLVHREALKRLAEEAQGASARGETAAARDAWRHALELLPPASRQAQAVAEKVAALNEQLGAAPPPPAEKPRWIRALGPFGVLALLLWKLKAVVLLVLSKAKLLLLGLTKASTFFSMLLSLGVYWTVWGWRIALGLVLSLYVHEMGHVAALRRYGVRATAPMFVPGLGAYVRQQQRLASTGEDARVGLAGPVWGLGAAVAAWLAFAATGNPYWAALARAGAWLNLFNLLPVWPLDGGSGFSALTSGQRWVVTAAFGALYFVTGDGLLAILAVVGAVRAVEGGAARPDTGVLVQFVGLVLTLGALVRLSVPGIPTPF
jgi:Zn-dependent protease